MRLLGTSLLNIFGHPRARQVRTLRFGVPNCLMHMTRLNMTRANLIGKQKQLQHCDCCSCLMHYTENRLQEKCFFAFAPNFFFKFLIKTTARKTYDFKKTLILLQNNSYSASVVSKRKLLTNVNKF